MSISQAGGNKVKPPVTAIIQARMNSKRLPGKSMLPLANKPLISHVIANLQEVREINRIVLATSEGEENLPLIECARQCGIEVFTGSESNVLERYYNAAAEFGGDYIVRATGDNPFTDPEYAAMAVEIALESKADLCSIANLPLGTAVEVIKKEALHEAYRRSDKPYEFEHVTPYIKKHEELFQIGRHQVDLPNSIENLRLTIDTDEDYELASLLYDALYRGAPLHLREVLDYLQQNPELASINSGVQQRPMTQSEQDS